MMLARPVCSIRLATVIGSKGKGVRENVKKTTDYPVDIRIRAKVDSLNVSVATAGAQYEIARRRFASPSSM